MFQRLKARLISNNIRTYLLCTIVSTSCSTFEPRHALIDQILVPAKDHKPLLCNRAYLTEEKKFTFECKDPRIEWERETLYKLKFICKIGKQMWAIHPTQPWLVRNHTESRDGGFWHKDKEVTVTEYIDIEKQYDFLIDSKMRCFSEEKYSFDIM